MDKIKSLVASQSDKLKYLFLLGALIGLFNTFARADYNFILYLYLYYIWVFMSENKENQVKEKITYFYILLYSGLIDIFWCIFWYFKWNKIEEDVECGLHTVVIILSWVGVLVKVIISYMISVSEWSNIKNTLPKSLRQKFNSEYFQQIDY